MKRIALLTFAMLMGIFCYAQSEHLKFSGIPIDGTITQFQAKLLKKGYTLDRLISSYFPIGTRAFRGIFIGEKVVLCVYYDSHTKIVYRVKAIIEDLVESIAEQKFQEIKDMLKKKYDNSYFSDGEKEGRPAFSICPRRHRTFLSADNNWKECYGEIDLFIVKDEDNMNYPYCFNVHIDYHDQINLDKHEIKKIDEL